MPKLEKMLSVKICQMCLETPVIDTQIALQIRMIFLKTNNKEIFLHAFYMHAYCIMHNTYLKKSCSTYNSRLERFCEGIVLRKKR